MPIWSRLAASAEASAWETRGGHRAVGGALVDRKAQAQHLAQIVEAGGLEVAGEQPAIVGGVSDEAARGECREERHQCLDLDRRVARQVGVGQLAAAAPRALANRVAQKPEHVERQLSLAWALISGSAAFSP